MTSSLQTPQTPRLFSRLVWMSILPILFMVPAASARTLTLAWDASADPSVDRYIVYWGTRSGDYPHNSDDCGHFIPAGTTTYEVTGLSSGGSYFFAVKAANADGLCSDFSDEAALPAIEGLESGFELSLGRYEEFHLSGTAAAGKPVEVFNGRGRIGSTVAEADGTWVLTVTGMEIGEGAIELSAVSTGAESERLLGNVQLTSGPLPGDLDDQNGVDPADALIALKVVTGISASASADRDATGDRRIGVSDAIFILQAASGFRDP